MTEHFIIFCTLVGKEIQNNIPPTKNNFKNYLNYVFSQTTPGGVSDIIQTLKLSKSNSLSLKVLKSIKGIISVPLCELIQQIFYIFYKNSSNFTATTDLFLFFPLLEKVYNTYSANQIFRGKQLCL